MSPEKPALHPQLNDTITLLLKGFEKILSGRKKILKELSDFIETKVKQNAKVELIFICTHNSRRSHISQIWAQVAAAYYGIPNVVTYSGGTEATAFNPRAVAAMEKAGFRIKRTTNADNPLYEISFSEEATAVRAFSKRYDADPNPRKKFAAIMTCSHADENCPVVNGMEKRISLSYDDPKDFDGTVLESQKYSERVMEIGTEIFYAFSRVKGCMGDRV